MAKLEFQDLNFIDEGDFIHVNFLRFFYFRIAKKDLRSIGEFNINENKIEFKGVSEKRAVNKFNSLLDKGFSELKSTLNEKPAVYVHRNSGIPLIGYNAFGIVDRDTNLLEIRPNTGCNLNCIFCSVDEGRDSKRQTDFVVEKDYLVSWVKRLAEFKAEPVQIYINPQGEPLLYAPLAELVREMKQLKNVDKIALNTNAVMLTKQKVDELVEAGLDRFNISINSLNQGMAEKLAGCAYNLKHVIEITEYAAKKAEVVIAPVWVPGFNDKDIEDLVKFAKRLKVKIGIQNFLSYSGGRNPAKEMEWKEFYEKLREFEKKHGIKLILCAEDLEIHKSKRLERPFRKGEVVKADIVCDGRLKGERLAVAKGRVIAVYNCDKKGFVKIKITRTKDNLFYGQVV